MGSQLASLYREVEMELKFHELCTDARWGIRLGRLGVSIPGVAAVFIPSGNVHTRLMFPERT